MKHIKIPKGLSEEELIEFVREEVRKAGGDPDTLYPVDYHNYETTEGDHVIYPASSLMPFTFDVQFKYANYAPKFNTSTPVIAELKEYNKEDFKEYDNLDSKYIREHLKRWSDLVRDTVK